MSVTEMNNAFRDAMRERATFVVFSSAGLMLLNAPTDYPSCYDQAGAPLWRRIARDVGRRLLRF